MCESVRRQIHRANAERDGMRGRIHFRIQLDALGDRMVHAPLHESAMARSMIRMLHVMRRRRRFFLFTLFTPSVEGSRCRDCRQQDRSAHR